MPADMRPTAANGDFFFLFTDSGSLHIAEDVTPCVCTTAAAPPVTSGGAGAVPAAGGAGASSTSAPVTGAAPAAAADATRESVRLAVHPQALPHGGSTWLGDMGTALPASARGALLRPVLFSGFADVITAPALPAPIAAALCEAMQVKALGSLTGSWTTSTWPPALARAITDPAAWPSLLPLRGFLLGSLGQLHVVVLPLSINGTLAAGHAATSDPVLLFASPGQLIVGSHPRPVALNLPHAAEAGLGAPLDATPAGSVRIGSAPRVTLTPGAWHRLLVTGPLSTTLAGTLFEKLRDDALGRDVLTHLQEETWPVGMATAALREEAMRDLDRLHCYLETRMGISMCVVRVPAASNYHLPPALRPVRDFFLRLNDVTRVTVAASPSK